MFPNNPGDPVNPPMGQPLPLGFAMSSHTEAQPQGQGVPTGCPYGPPPKKRRAASFWIALALFFLLGFSMLINLGLLADNVTSSASFSEQPFEEKVLSGFGDTKVVVIDLQGIIMDPPTGALFSGPSLVTSTIKKLRQAAADPDVQAIVIRIDSGGGGVTASDVIFNEVKKIKQLGKKVVVHMGDICASGGYYISAPADAIVASPTTITGSIGVMISAMDASKLCEEKLGIKIEPIKSGPHKDILSPSRPMSVEEKKIMQDLVDAMYERFVQLVFDGRKGRPNFPADIEGVRKIADGSVFTGQRALELGLVDQVGYYEEALTKAMELAGIKTAKVVQYKRTPGLMELLSGDAEGRVNLNAGVQIDASHVLDRLTPRLEYRWAPRF